MNEIQIITQNDLPEGLLQIPQPPHHLYIRGSLSPPRYLKSTYKKLCIVGSRKYSPYGKEACEYLIQGLKGQNVSIISGLALGIDSIAHKAALSNEIHTIAIPGSGINDSVIYPRSHTNLAHEILRAGGGLISEFEPDFKATAWSFPQRNRIMAGLSEVVLIIEAEEKSGSLITARMALDYNRDVCAMPGPIFSETSKGTHALIRNGAIPITSPSDLIEALGLDIQHPSNTTQHYKNISDQEQEILQLLKEPITKDEIIRKISKPIQEINILLSSLEIKGIIIEHNGYMRII